MNATQPPVAALVPTWKAESFIEELLHCLAAQSYGNLHVVISEDASPDGTRELCEQFAAGRENWTVIAQERNLGWVGNSNALLRYAKGLGKYQFFAFHDDLLAPTYVEKLVTALEQAPGAAVAFPDMDTLLETGQVETGQYREMDGVTSASERCWRMLRRTGPWWVPNHGIFTAEAAQAVGGLRTHSGGEFAADWSWLVALALQGEFVRVPETLVKKRFLGSNLSRQWQWNAQERLGLVADVLGRINESPLSWLDRMQLQSQLTALTAKRSLARLAGTGAAD